MAEIKGILTTLNHRLPAGVDATRLAQWRLRDGSSYQALRNRIATEITQLNADLVQSWGNLIYITTEDYFEYQNGGALADMPDTTELDRAENSKAETVGHTIDLREKSDGIGGSGKFWRDARMSVIDANIAQKIQKGRQTLEKSILTRLFNNTVNAVGAAGTGFDMPFANASASVSYAPPAYGGNTFDTTHDHYIGYNSGASATAATMLNGLAATVVHHGHTGNLRAVVSEADIALYHALGDSFIMPTAGRVVIMDRGGDTSGATFFNNRPYGDRPMSGTYYIGDFVSTSGIIELYATARVPTGHAAVYNSYGINSPMNPIAVRIHPDVGFGFYIREIPDETTTYPVKQIDVVIEYGVSTNAPRTNGASGFLVSGGAYANATIV